MRFRRVPAMLLASAALVVAGCGVQPSSVQDGGHAPTGIAAGTPVYYVNDTGKLVTDRRGGRLGTIGQALKMLFSTPHPEPGLRSYVGTSPVILEFPITRTRHVITVMLPIDRSDVRRDIGIEQLVCTALAVHQQSGGPATTTVRLRFTHGPATDPRHCPVLPKR